MTKFLFLVAAFIFSFSAFARPEYALTNGYIQCSTCHVSPFGGGPRNLNGKLFGAHGISGMAISNQDMFSADLRLLATYPLKKTGSRASGPALMTVIPWANVPVTKNSDGKVTSRLVAGYGLGGLAQGARDVYAQFDLLPDEEKAVLKHFMVGRFNAPFGLLTDEHRTFARQATMTSVNEFEFGGAISGDPTKSIHYDLAVTNGFQNGGTAVATGLPYAVFANIRHMPTGMPFFVGFSGMLHRKLDLDVPYKPYALSTWTGLSVARLTGGMVPLTLLGEGVIAKGWNGSRNSYINRFIPQADTAWSTAVANTQSLSIYAMAILELTNRLALVYKFDEFAPSKNYTADAFVRHSAGIRWYINSNAQLIARHESSKAGRPGISEDDSQNSRDGVLAILLINL